MRTSLRLIVPCLLVAVIGGCNSTKSTGAAQPETEYVYISETGSNIPRKVRKGQKSDGSQNIEKGDSRTLETFQRDQTLRNMRKDGT